MPPTRRRLFRLTLRTSCKASFYLRHLHPPSFPPDVTLFSMDVTPVPQRSLLPLHLGCLCVPPLRLGRLRQPLAGREPAGRRREVQLRARARAPHSRLLQRDQSTQPWH